MESHLAVLLIWNCVPHAFRARSAVLRRAVADRRAIGAT